MDIAGDPTPRFLVEWYRPEIGVESLDVNVAQLTEYAAAATAAGLPVHLLAMFAVPTDEIVLAIFASASEQTVAEVCRQADCPAQRVTPAVDARFWEES
jgi:hypothetical protein